MITGSVGSPVEGIMAAPLAVVPPVVDPSVKIVTGPSFPEWNETVGLLC